MYLVDLRNLQEQVKKHSVLKILIFCRLNELLTCSIDLKKFANSRPSTSNIFLQ